LRAMRHDCHQLLHLLALMIGVGGTVVGSVAYAAHEVVPVVDLHVDISYQVNYKHRDIERVSGQFVANRLVLAGVVGLVLPLYVPHEVSPEGPRLVDLEASWATMFGLTQRTAPYNPPGSAQEPGRVATWFALEGAAPFAGHPEWVAKWVAQGVRIWGLVHVHDNALATSAGLGPGRLKHDVGLSPEGHQLVQAIHAAHALVDVSHASDRTVEDILEHARRDGVPVIATHSNANRLAPHARNLTDAQLYAIAATGGVIGVNFHGNFLARDRTATLDDVVQQIRYMAGLVGAEHVALGSDYEGGIRPPPELRDVRGYQRLASALRSSGFSASDVRRIFSDNVLALLRTTQK